MHLQCQNPIVIKNTHHFKTPSRLVSVEEFNNALYDNSLYFRESYAQNHFVQLPSNSIKVPCGKCPLCVARKRHELVVRANEEFRAGFITKFVTFTYDNKNLPWRGQLSSEDIKNFFKRLRSKLEYHHKTKGTVSYICVGEYGENYSRAHYHALITFKKEIPGFKLEKNRFYDPFVKSDKIYSYKTKRNTPIEFDDYDRLLFDCWNKGSLRSESPRGVESMSAVMYATKYMTKTQKRKDLPLLPRIQISIGYGSAYIESMIDWYKADPLHRVYYIDRNDNKKFTLPLYYFNKLRKLGIFASPSDDKDTYNINKIETLLIQYERIQQKIANIYGNATPETIKDYIDNYLPSVQKVSLDKFNYTHSKPYSPMSVKYGEENILSMLSVTPDEFRRKSIGHVNSYRVIDTNIVDDRIVYALAQS